VFVHVVFMLWRAVLCCAVLFFIIFIFLKSFFFDSKKTFFFKYDYDTKVSEYDIMGIIGINVLSGIISPSPNSFFNFFADLHHGHLFNKNGSDRHH